MKDQTRNTFHTVERIPAPSGIPCDAILRKSRMFITFFDIYISINKNKTIQIKSIYTYKHVNIFQREREKEEKG